MKKIDKKELHDLFENLRSRKQNAYNQLYEKYFSLVYGIVFSILKNKDDSEDVTHEIFTKIYKLNSDKLPTENEASWLFTVSKNECFLYLRKARPNISIDEIYEMPSKSDDIENVIDREYYNKLMSGLKEDEKMIVSLKVLSNFTFKKISQVMGIPIGTVQWKYYNAINSLRISVGSLVGAVLSFIFIIARGEFLKNKDYISEPYYENNIDEKNENATESKDQFESEKELDSTNENVSKSVPQNNEIAETLENFDKKNNWYDNFDSVQVAFFTLGMAFLIIFIIFLKKYQQKLKLKSSK